MDKKQIAGKLKKLREFKYPDRLEFTRESGFTKQVVAAIENGGSVLSPTRLEKYLKALDTKLSTFFLELENESEGVDPESLAPTLGFEEFYADLGRIIRNDTEENRHTIGRLLKVMADACDPQRRRIDEGRAHEKGNIAPRERKKTSQGRRRA